MSASLGRNVMDIARYSVWIEVLPSFFGFCKAFSTQEIKCCSVDCHLCVNTSINAAVLYIHRRLLQLY